jgi:hypothetical protein
MILATEVLTKICTNCGRELPATEEYFSKQKLKLGKYGLRADCKGCANIYSKEYYEDNSEKYMIMHKLYHDDNKTEISERINANHHNLKLQVINHYGGCCTVCGITDLSFLTIDHINNDGSRGVNDSGSHLYRKLKRNDFPPGFQVLCWNHNFLKQIELNITKHLDTKRANAGRRYIHDIKLMVISHYGSECECCGEPNIDLLTIDHVNGGGKKHRRGINSMYHWLIKNGFPDGYRVLCFNCNSGRSVNGGICPHKEGYQ